jgi:hypothetical protein
MTDKDQAEVTRFAEAVRKDYREMYGREMPQLNQELTVWQILCLILPWNS